MLIIIDNDDGAQETLTAELEGAVVAKDGGWLPGILVEMPDRCAWRSGYFETALNEGGERSGHVRPEPEEPDFIGFHWRLVGNEADACRDKLARWMNRVGAAFNPEIDGRAYLYQGLLRLLSDEEAVQYDRDRECWITYLEDPTKEAAVLNRLRVRPETI